ncbi:MAG: hypothetical protein J6331_00690 [Lentisphaeria bacterium]|nr:hypothetical protein [Lentisphaeria bacterium]
MGIVYFIVFLIIVLNILSGLKRLHASQSGQSTKNARPGTGDPFSSLLRGGLFETKKGKLNGAWMESAGEMGLAFLRPQAEYPFPIIDGTLDGMHINISLRENPAAKGMETCYRILYPEDLELDFYFVKASPQRIHHFSKGKTRWDRLDGDLPKDVKKENIFLTAKDVNILETFLTAERKETLFWCLGTLEELFIDDRSVSLIFSGTDDSCEIITSRIRLLLQLGRTFGLPDCREKKLFPTGKGVLKVPAETPEKKSVFPSGSPAGKKVFTPIYSPLSTASKEEKPSPVAEKPLPADTVKKAEEKVPSQVVTPRIRKTGASFIPPGAAESISAPPPEKTERKAEKREYSSSLTPEELVEQLFANTFPGSEEKEYFLSHKGETVTWKGHLESAYSFSSDFLFGHKGGVKAKFLLMEYKREGDYLSRKVYAIVCLPVSEEEFLRKNLGAELVFRGKLFHFEGISREIMLSEGTLVK